MVLFVGHGRNPLSRCRDISGEADKTTANTNVSRMPLVLRIALMSQTLITAVILTLIATP